MLWDRMHTQLSLLGSALGFMYLISAGLFTPRGNFQALFSYAYFPVTTRTLEHTNARTSEEHPFQSAPWCCVMCPNSRNALWALGRSAKAVLSWASGPPLLAAQPEGLAHLGSFSEHLGTVTGYFYGLGKKVIQEGTSLG